MEASSERETKSLTSFTTAERGASVESPEAHDASSQLVQRDGSQSTSSESGNESDRENRFEGPASTWRSYTEAERTLAASLNQQQAGDLSMHLYNAHALKARVRDPQAFIDVKPYDNKKRWIKRNQDGTLPWHPKDSWTAWPLPPEDAPRSTERFGVPFPNNERTRHGFTYRKQDSWRPGDELEDEVLALMLSLAKEQFRERRYQDSSTPERAADRSNEKALNNDENIRSEAEASDNDSDSSMGEVVANSADDSFDEVNASRPDTELTLLDDDEEASDLLRPMICHITSKIDDLLLGLHKSRQGVHRSNQHSSRSRSRSKRSKSRIAPSRSASRQHERSKSSARQSDEYSGSGMGDASEENENADAQEEKKSRRAKKLNPRDWSEVLAIAALVGWESDVIDRSARRCADLFGEHTGTATMMNTATNAQRTGRSVVARDSIEPDQVRPPGILCPVEDCKRKNEPFREVWRWREHLKRVHRYDKERISQAETAVKDGAHCVAECQALI